MGWERGSAAGAVMLVLVMGPACGDDGEPAGADPMALQCPTGQMSNGVSCVPVMAVAPVGTPQGGMPAPGDGDMVSPPGDGDTAAMPGDGDTTAMPGDGDTAAMPGDGDTTAMPGDGDSGPMTGDGDGAMASSGCGAASPPADGDQEIDVDGLTRAFIVAVPDGYDADTPHKLVFAWHGLGGTAASIARRGYYGLESRAAGSTIFVAGQGLDTSNQVGSGPGWDNMGGRDVAFTAAMLDWLRASYCIDNDRIFSVGMSYGGIMSNTVGCALGEDFRAIAPMAGLGPIRRGAAGCTGQVAAWITHGNQDTIVPYASGQASRDYWVEANGCDTSSMAVGGDGCVAYDGCTDGYPVHWCEFTGGHTVPSFAADAVWAFFSQF